MKHKKKKLTESEIMVARKRKIKDATYLDKQGQKEEEERENE